MNADLMDRIEWALVDTMRDFVRTVEEGVIQSPEWFVDCPPANGNRGVSLLRSSTKRDVISHLDAIKEIGVDGVTLQIQYPLLDWDFPDRDLYGEFYEWVANEAASRGLLVAVETSPAFSGTRYSTIVWDYGIYDSKEEYLLRRSAQAIEIANRLKPKYLSLSHEPGTERAITGIGLTDDDIVSEIGKLREAAPDGTMVGGGLPIVEASHERLEAYMKVCQFLNVHVYPIHAPGMDNAFLKLSEIARMSTIPVICLETWPFKALSVEMLKMKDDPIGMSIVFYDRDPYFRWGNFVDPLFIRCLYMLGAYGVAAVSLFWPNYLWAYYRGKSNNPKVVSERLAARVKKNIKNGKLSPTGEALRSILSQRGVS